MGSRSVPKGKALLAMERSAAQNPGPGPVEVVDSRDEALRKPGGKGQLQFTGDFEGGNLGTVRMISDFEYELSIRSDSGNPKYRLWFHFKVSNCKSGQRVLFSIVNFSKSRSLFREGMSPLVSSSSRPRWERIPPKNCFYYRSPRANNAYVLSFVFVFDREADKYAFAYSFPFTYTHQQRLLAELEWRNLPCLRRELLCRSVQQRRVDVLYITNPEPKTTKNGDPLRKRAVVVCARVHPGETPASHCITGFINYITSDRKEVKKLRDNVMFIVIPMLNPDGTFLGNYRTCSLGTDLNRMWRKPGKLTEPTLAETKALIQEYYNSEEVQLDFVMDVHAHSTATTGFFLCNPPSDKNLAGYERASEFPSIFAKFARDFSLGACKFCDDPAKAGSGRRALGDMLPNTMCYTLELSFFPTPGNNATTLCSEEGYMEFGQQLGQAFHEYYSTRRPLNAISRQGERGAFRAPPPLDTTASAATAPAAVGATDPLVAHNTLLLRGQAGGAPASVTGRAPPRAFSARHHAHALHGLSVTADAGGLPTATVAVGRAGRGRTPTSARFGRVRGDSILVPSGQRV